MIETNKIAPETTTEVNEAVPECAQAPDAEIPALDTAVDQALALIASQGLAFDIMHMTLSDGGATLELHFARRPS